MPAIMDLLRRSLERAYKETPARLLRDCDGVHAVAYQELAAEHQRLRQALETAIDHLERVESAFMPPVITTEERNAAYDRAMSRSGGGSGFDDAYAREMESLERSKGVVS